MSSIHLALFHVWYVFIAILYLPIHLINSLRRCEGKITWLCLGYGKWSGSINWVVLEKQRGQIIHPAVQFYVPILFPIITHWLIINNPLTQIGQNKHTSSRQGHIMVCEASGHWYARFNFSVFAEITAPIQQGLRWLVITTTFQHHLKEQVAKLPWYWDSKKAISKI